MRQVITAALLKSIKVLYRTADHLALYGIPYPMRADIGQEPRHIWQAHRDYEPPLPGHYGSRQVNISDWIWLGTPGWFGDMKTEETILVEAFLKEHASKIPDHPNEWCEL